MDENNQALTTPEEAPPSGDAAPVEQPGADVIAAPSAESPAGDKPATLEDAISAALAAEEKEPESQPEASPAEEKAESEPSVDAPEGKKEEPAQEEKKDDLNLDALSKKAQNRFRELANEKAVLDEIRRFTGDDNGFNHFRDLLRLHAEDPAQAVPLLEKVLQDARSRAGLVVEADDIKQKLDDGLIDEPTALELSQARKAREHAQREAEQRKQQEAERAQEAQVLALNNWEKSVRERNPDYDSIAERVQDRFVALATKQYPRTTDEAVALANQAMADVTGWTKRVLPAKKPMKVATSSGSSAKVSAKPQSLEDIVNRVLG